MRYLKVLGLAAVVSAALLGFAGGAAATTVTSPKGTAATPTIVASSEGHIVLHNPIAKIECNSTIEGKVESHGASVTAEGNVSSLSFTRCTNAWHVTTVTPGSLILHWSSGYNGTVTSTQLKVDTTRFGVTCVYETNNTDIGTITGGLPATVHLEASIPINATESSGICGAGNTKLTGSYRLTSPETLYVDDGTAPPPPSATITSPTGTVATPTIKGESEGHVTIDNAGGSISCGSTLEAKVEQHGAEVSAGGKVSSLTFTGCTNSWHVTTVIAGTLGIDWTSGYNGTVTASGLKIDATRLGVTCVYESKGTNIGTVTGGAPATVDLEGNLAINTTESSGVCGTGTSTLTGSYKLTSPETLYVDPGLDVIPGATITSPTGTVATPTIKGESESGHITLANPIANISCSSGIEGKVERHGGAAPAEGKVSSLTFTGCTNSWHVTTVSTGTLAINWTSGYNGTVTSSGLKIDGTRLGPTCVYETTSTKLGTITGGAPATIDLNASIPINTKESSGLCGTSAAKLEGSYKLTSPETLYVDEGATAQLSGTATTSPTGTVATPTIKGESESGHLSLANPLATINCSSAFEAKVESHGAEVAAEGKVSSLTFTGCTNSWHVTAVSTGTLAIDWTSGYDGRITWSGLKFTATRVGVLCVYEDTANTVGTITGGSPATIDLSTTIPINTAESSGLCGSGAAAMAGSYKLTSPESLYVDVA